jgi:hypothetical protein
VTVETGKIIENVHLQLFVYEDELTAAFASHEIYKHFETTIKIHNGSAASDDVMEESE